MMGQQQMVTGSALRRMLLVLTVALMMAATIAASAMPAFAAGASHFPNEKAYYGSCDRTNNTPWFCKF